MKLLFIFINFEEIRVSDLCTPVTNEKTRVCESAAEICFKNIELKQLKTQ